MNYFFFTYKNTPTAGVVIVAPMRKTAPGRTSIVAVYTVVYKGTYNKGIKFSVKPNIEFTLPVNKIICFNKTECLYWCRGKLTCDKFCYSLLWLCASFFRIVYTSRPLVKNSQMRKCKYASALVINTAHLSF